MLLKTFQLFFHSTILQNSLARLRSEEIQQKMEENRHKFDQEMIEKGNTWTEEDYEDYDYNYDDEDQDEFFANQDDEDFHPDDLEPHVKKIRFENIIKRMDLDKDDYIEREELAKWTLMALQRMDSKTIREDFENSDQDGDDFVTFVEYVNGIYGVAHNQVMDFKVYEAEQSPELADFNRLWHREYARFTSADKNNDEKLDKEEYKQFYNPGYDHSSTEQAISSAMAFVDTDSDGSLSFQEFLDEGKVKLTHKMMEKDINGLREVFDQMDLDDNDFLNDFELFLWINEDNGEIAADETDHLIQEVDVDQDDLLSYDEMMLKIDEFMESDATEYGMQLQHDEL